MKGVNPTIKQEIIATLSDLGHGATTQDIEAKVRYERHTISKYLLLLRREGLVDYKAAGKVKFWFINKVPLRTITQSSTDTRTYIENILLKVLSNIPVGVAVIDSSYTIQFMNDELIDTYDMQQEQLFYKQILGLANPLPLDKLTQLFDRSSVTVAELQIDDKFGHLLDIKASKMINPDGLVCAILIIDDIHEHKKSQEKMRKLSQAVEQTADIVMVTDRDGIIEYVNPAFKAVTGYSEDEVVGKSPNILKSGKHPKRFYETMWKTILAGKAYRNDVVDKRKDGSLFTEQKTITPIWTNGRITHYVSTGKVIEKQVK